MNTQIQDLDKLTKMEYHLHDNHYPPISRIFAPVALKAIDLAVDGDTASVLDLPNGNKATVSQIIEGLDLDWFVENAEES